MPVVVTKVLTRKYLQGQKEITAVNNANIDIEQGEFVAIIGGSGSGKTTLLNLIGCTDSPTEGTITVDGIVVTDPKTQRSCLRYDGKR